VAFVRPKLKTTLVAAVVAALVIVPVVAFAYAPSQPTLTATPGEKPTIALLEWSASDTAARYSVSVATSPTGPYRIVGETEALTLSYAFTEGIGGVPYYFRVAAINAEGEQSAPAQPVGPVTSTWISEPHQVADRTSNKCECCHVPHQALAAPLLRTEIATSSPGQVATCMSCHDGKIASAGNVASGSRDTFGLWSGHALDTSTSAGGLTNDCASCHDPHRSSAANPMLPQSTINNRSVSAAGNSWCLACHDNDNSWFGVTYPLSSAPAVDASGYPVTGTWLGKTTYNGPTNAHRLVPETTQTLAPTGEVRRVAGDCLYCHAAHRGPNTYDGLVATFRPSSASTLADDKSQGTYAALCFTCHGGAIPSGFATAPVDIKRFVTSGGDTAGHSIVTSGGLLPVGAPLPCYECHNPHGSERGNDSMISDVRGGSLATTGGVQAVRAFCFTCHTTTGTAKGWDSEAATYTAVAPGDKVVGIPRTGGVLKLPSFLGHAQNDSASCYDCHGSGYGAGANNVHNPSLGGYNTATHESAPLSQVVMISGASFGPVACADCHATDLGAEHGKTTSSSAASGCSTCHPTPRDTLTPSWDKSCAQGGCHTVGSSAPMHADIDATHTPAAGQTCYVPGCHPAAETASLAETHRNASAVLGGETRTSCQVCHWNGVPASGECASCHPDRVDGSHGSTGAHGFTTGADAVVDGDAGCTNSGSGCHGTDTLRDNFASYHPTTGCADGACHTSPSKATYAGNGDCQTCHDGSFTNAPTRAVLATEHYNETTHTAGSLSTAVSAGGSASATCASCHNPNPPSGSGGLLGQHTNITPAVGSTYGPTVSCVECHNDNRGGGNAEVLAHWTTGSCSDCHTIGSSAPMHSTTAPVVNTTSTNSCGESGTNCHTTYDVHALHKNAAGGCNLTGCHDYNQQALRPVLTTCGQAGGCHADYTSATHTHAVDAVKHRPTTSTQADDTSFASTACGACHDIGTASASLTLEHTLLTSAKTINSLNTCLNCHNNNLSTSAISGDWAARDTTSACAACHTGTLAIHADTNPAAHSDVPSPGCSSSGIGCHNTGDLSQVGDTSAVNTNIHSTCLRCHDRTATAPNVAYNPVNDTCGSGRACHGAGTQYDPATAVHNGGAGLADGNDSTHHTDTSMSGSISEGVASATCAVCHSGTLATAHASTLTGWANVCTGCHNSTLAGDVAAKQVKVGWTNNDCGDCHVAGPSAVKIPNLHSAYGTASHAGTSAAGCGASGTNCHTTYDLAILHSKTKVNGCQLAGCHDSVDKDMAGATKTCGQSGGCHAGYTIDNHTHSSDAARHQPTTTTQADQTSFASTACGSCHDISPSGSSLTTEHALATSAKTTNANVCLNCHNNPASTAAITSDWSDKDTATACAQCHTSTLAIHADANATAHTKTNAGCADTGVGCHPTANLSQVGTPSTTANIHSTCLRCHDRTGAAGWTSALLTTPGNVKWDPAATTCGASTGCHPSAYYSTATMNHRIGETDVANGNDTAHHTAGASFMASAENSGAATNVCSDCHSSTLLATHSTTSAGAIGCTTGGSTAKGCHNTDSGTIAAASASQVKASWTNDICTDCHTVKHDTIATSHTGTSTQGCGASGAGCHSTYDLAALHQNRAGGGGCRLSGCHDTANRSKRPTQKTCGSGGACHTAYTATAGHRSNTITGNEATHTAGTMSATEGVYLAGSYDDSRTCSTCHSATMLTAHTATSVGTVGCTAGGTGNTGCHNQTTPINAANVIKNTDWQATKLCADCHGSTNGPVLHDAVVTGHVGVQGSYTCSAASCHKTTDLRIIHAKKKYSIGCTQGSDANSPAGCHTAINTRPTQKTCGSGNGGCHADKTNTNHGPDHNANQALGAPVGSLASTTYQYGTNVGCFQSGTNLGCHFADLRLEHGSTAYQTANGVASAVERTMNAASKGSNTDYCTICHATGQGTAGSYASRTAIVGAITNGDYRCTSCHFEASDAAGTTGVQKPHATTEKIANAPQGTTYEWSDWSAVGGGGGHNSMGITYPRTVFPNPINGVTVGTSLVWGGAASLVLPWTATSPVLCTDCHYSGTAPNGPQGATVPWYVTGGAKVTSTITTHWYTTLAPTVPAQCSSCHAALSGSVHGKAKHKIACEGCHVRIPHAWKRPRLLRRTVAAGGVSSEPVDTLPYANSAVNGTTAYTVTAGQTNFGSNASCNTAGCSGHTASTPYWP